MPDSHPNRTLLLRLAFALLLALAVVWFGLRVLDSLLGPFAPLLGTLVLAVAIAVLLRRPDGRPLTAGNRTAARPAGFYARPASHRT